MNLSGKTGLITGANTGLGLATSKRFAALGADTVLVCRTKEKGEQALLDIKSELPDASLALMICDLSSMRSIRNFVEEFKERYPKLDILYNNAAVMKQRRTLTEDGFETMFQVNYLAPFVLMNAFFGQLRQGSSPIIINNGRPAYKLRLKMDDLQFVKKYSMYNSFFVTKLCLLFASLELSRRDISSGIAVTMIDPGPFKSELVRDRPLMGWVKNLFSSSVDKAADNLLHHITSEDVGTRNGKVFKERQEWPLTAYWSDTSVSERLWSETESLLSR